VAGSPGPPDFLWNLVASMNFMRLSLRKGARAAPSSAAWQESRVREMAKKCALCALGFLLGGFFGFGGLFFRQLYVFAIDGGALPREMAKKYALTH